MAQVIEIAGPLDICRAQRLVSALARQSGLSSRAGFQLLIAVSELSNHLFVSEPRKGRLRVSRSRKGERRGLEVTAEVQAGGRWAIGLPSVERLVDELDAGFGPDGSIRVSARVWEVLVPGPSAALAES